MSLTVAPDTRMGVVGPNGVGKTTLLRLLAGLERPAPDEHVLTAPITDSPEETVDRIVKALDLAPLH